MTGTQGTPMMMAPPPPAAGRLTALLLLLLLMAAVVVVVDGFSGRVPPQQQPQKQPPPTSPYERRDPIIPSAAELDAIAAAGTTAPADALPNAPPRLVLGPGSRVAVAGAEGPLGRLVTRKLFQSQLRPYLVVPSLAKVPTGLGLDQYRGLTRYISMDATDADAAATTTDGTGAPCAPELDGLVLCGEAGYTAKQVKDFLRRVTTRSEDGASSSLSSVRPLKRVVMLSSVGVNRRDDLMVKLRHLHTNLDERHAAEAALMEAAARDGFTYTLVRVGKLRGGGGEYGLGDDFYDDNKNLLEARADEDFDMTKRGFTLSYCDNILGDTGRVLAAETVVKALGSEHVSDVAIAICSEDGKTYPNFAVAPWDLF